jgi:hypothetical protein
MLAKRCATREANKSGNFAGRGGGGRKIAAAFFSHRTFELPGNSMVILNESEGPLRAQW